MSDAELKHYGIKMRDGLTSESRERFLGEMQNIGQMLAEAKSSLPFAKRLIEKDRDWYAVMYREHGEKAGYVADGMKAIASIDEAIKALNRANHIIGAISLLEGGYKQNEDGHSWSYHGKEKAK